MNPFVRKSFVNGKFVRATELTAKQAAKVRAGGQYAAARGANGNRKDKLLSSYRDQTNALAFQDLRRTISNPTKKGRKEMTTLAQMNNWGAFTHRAGGKSSGKSYVYVNPKAKDSYISRKTGERHAAAVGVHEQGHARIKRSEYRIHGQIGTNPRKLGREEGRADYESLGHYQGKGHKPDKYFQGPSGYSTTALATEAQTGGAKKLKRKHIVALYEAAGMPKPSKKDIKAVQNSREMQFHRGYTEVQNKMKKAGAKVQKSYKDQPRTIDGKFTSDLRSVGFTMIQPNIPIDNVDVETDEIEKAFERQRANFHHSRAEANSKKAEHALYATLGSRATDAPPWARTKKRMAKLERYNAKAKRHTDRRDELDAKFARKKGIIKSGEQSKPNAANYLSAGGGAVAGYAVGDHFARRRRLGKLPMTRTNKASIVGGAALMGTGVTMAVANSRKKVAKGMPDVADVHVKGVLRPVGKVKRDQVSKSMIGDAAKAAKSLRKVKIKPKAVALNALAVTKDPYHSVYLGAKHLGPKKFNRAQGLFNDLLERQMTLTE